jgi:hypothetical protein
MARMLGAEDLDVRLDDLAEVEGHRPQLGAAAGLDAGEVEQVADDSAEALRFGVDVPEISPRPLRRHFASEQQLAESLERRQRGPQLVRRDREKFVLGLIELAEPSRRPGDLLCELLREVPLTFREPRILDGERQV